MLLMLKISPNVDTLRSRYVMGLVAWGVDCAQTDIPGVYVRVGKFTNWIDNCPHPNNHNDYSQCARAL